MGDSVVKIKKGYSHENSYGIDRFQDIREGPAQKKGIIDVHKKTKEKRPIENYEVSFQLNEAKVNPSFNPLIRVDQPN